MFHINNNFNVINNFKIIADKNTPAIYPDNINVILKTFSNNKSPGIDNIPVKIIKLFHRKNPNYLPYIYNQCLQTNTFPDNWKVGKIILLHKLNELLDKPDSYRPITLLPLFGKFFEKILITHLHDNVKQILSDYQFGSIKFRSTEIAVNDLINTVNDQLKRYSYVAVIFFDLSKAFDTLNIVKLLDILRMECQIPFWLYNIIQNYFTNRKSYVDICNITYEILIQGGVPQGSVLEPLL